MNPAHVHLVLNHFPIVGTALAALLLGIALASRTFLAKETARGITLAGTILLAVSGASAAAAYLTGEPAEEQVEDMPGVDEPAIEEHEERAEVATVFAVLLGVGAVAASIVGGRREGSLTVAVPFGAALLSSGLMAWTGAAGGKIHHPEVRDGAALAAPEAGARERSE